MTDRHLGDTQLNFVKRHLEKDSNKKNVFAELIEQINVARKDKEKQQLRGEIEKLKESFENLEGEELRVAKHAQTKLKEAYNNLNDQVSLDPILAQLNLERACLSFLQKGQGVNKHILINFLREIDKALHKMTSQVSFAESEFANDVKGLIKNLKQELGSKGKVKEGLKVLFTDDPIDLLLCGTDVSGSCQRLDGESEKNKGLLGYLVDGKNRLLAIKEEDKIIARCILRLLWDGEQSVIYRERFYPRELQNCPQRPCQKRCNNLRCTFDQSRCRGSQWKRLRSIGRPRTL